jgi:endonuclease/exonuclease/phosphatase family metal-dependent hydrolase
MTYNVMRGRYNCYEEKLKANEDFRRATHIKSFNNRADFVSTNLATMADHIRQYDVDILAIQEVQESPSSTPSNNEISTATYLAQQLDMTFTFSPTLFDNEVQMQYGTAVLLNHHRFHLIAVEIISLPLGLEPRNSPCLTIQSRTTNITFRACSIHFDHHATDNTIRLQQANTFINWLTKGPYYPTALLGDFNANKTSSTLTNLYKYFFDDHSPDSSRPTWSECGEMLKDKIDYILLDRQSNWTIKSFLHGLNMKKFYPSIDLTMLSDHVPLFTETTLSVPMK